MVAVRDEAVTRPILPILPLSVLDPVLVPDEHLVHQVLLSLAQIVENVVNVALASLSVSVPGVVNRLKISIFHAFAIFCVLEVEGLMQ